MLEYVIREIGDEMRNAIILAAGKGTRMKSSQSKVMHTIIDRPMLAYIIDALKAVDVQRIVVVVGYQAESIQSVFTDVEYALQQPQLGTGHAVMQCTQLKDAPGDTLVINGDGPCIQPETLEALFQANQSASLTLLTAKLEDGKSYGRIVRDENGNVSAIVEAKDCTPEQREINEINAGMYCFNNKDLFDNLDKLQTNNAQNEYYLTDMVSILAGQGKRVNGMVIENRDEVMGINDCLELHTAYEWMKKKINTHWMKEGVQIVDPNRTVIGKDVTIGHDVIIHPNVELLSKTRIGNHVEILPGSYIKDSVIEDDVRIESSEITDAHVGSGTTVGPMAHLRNHTNVGCNCRIGNFVEFKNTNFGDGSKCAHLTYIGDCDVGKNVNIGCGVVTVNYDGKEKHRTVIKDGAFIGSNVNLIAPVTIGANALLAAGSTITDDVEDGDMGIARSHQSIKHGFGDLYKNK